MTHDSTYKPIVVKLGGSTAQERAYRDWLKALAQSKRPVIIVPGGGRFADAVRSSQQALDFNDATAHDLALLSMNQFGRVLLQHLPGFRALTRVSHCAASDRPHSSVWLPDPDELATFEELEMSWRTTGDSLACWMCHQLQIPELAIIKSVDAVVLDQPLARLTSQGIIDPLCQQKIAEYGLKVTLIGATQIETLSQIINPLL